MSDLKEFRKWADSIGHYNVVEAVDRYLAFLAAKEAKEKNNE